MSHQGHITRRRGWCPGVRRPMETGDGLLVRLHPFGGRLSADQVRLVAGAARQYGNGYLDITARGNLQIRGVNDRTYPELLTLLERESLVESEGDGPNRLTALSPLAGLDPHDHFDAGALAQAIERTVDVVDGLPAKVFVTVDGGGLMPLDRLGADLHLVATGGQDVVAFGVPLPGGPHWIGATSLASAPEAVRVILAGFSTMRRAGQTGARRLRDLQVNLVRQLAECAALEPSATPLQRPAAPCAGFLPSEGGAVLLALPFGRSSAAQLERAAAWSERFGNGELRLSFTRGILLPGIAEDDLSRLLNEASRAGFITDADDPRLHLLACPGRPDCASALTAAPADALRIVGSCADLLKNGATLHVSGCPKGCAHPGKADLTLVGREDGRYDVVPNGSARDAAPIHLSIDEIMSRLLPLNTLDDLLRAFAEGRQ